MSDRSLDSIDNRSLEQIKEKTLRWDFKLIHMPGIRQEATDPLYRRQTPKSLITACVSALIDVENTADF